MKTWTTRNGTVVTELLHGRCNCFLVARGESRVLVDTGRTNAWPKLRSRLDAAGVGRADRLAVVLTHTHFDHAENAARLKEEYGARIIVHRSEAGFLESGDSPLPRGTLPFTKAIVKLAGSWAQRRYRYTSVEADLCVDDRHDLGALGLQAFLLHTPWHSSGSLSVVVEDEVALVGDTVFGVVRGAVFPPYADDPQRMVASWGLLLATGCSVFLPAHGSERSRKTLARSYERRRARTEQLQTL